MAECFPYKPRWCPIEQVCQGIKCKAFLTVLNIGYFPFKQNSIIRVSVHLNCSLGSPLELRTLIVRSHYVPPNHLSSAQPSLVRPTISRPPNHLSSAQPSLFHPTISRPPNHLSSAQPSLVRPTISCPPNHLSSTQPSLVRPTISRPPNHLSSAQPSLVRLTTIFRVPNHLSSRFSCECDWPTTCTVCCSSGIEWPTSYNPTTMTTFWPSGCGVSDQWQVTM